MDQQTGKARFHLPGLFGFYEFYKVFLPLFYGHREYFYDWAEIGSLYGAPADCIWGGGRVGSEEGSAQEVLALLREFGISARLTFSNSRLCEAHLSDRKCNRLCARLEAEPTPGGVIVHSELLTRYLRERYPGLYLVSSTTKVITDFAGLTAELEREEFRYVVPDFRLNRPLERLSGLPQRLKDKVEFLCNECCYPGCRDRKECYAAVSRRILGEETDFTCRAPYGQEGYRFSRAMRSPAFLSAEDIRTDYLGAGFTNYKIEGRGLGSAIVLEFLLHYLTKPEYHLQVREAIYLDSMLELF